MKIMRATDPRAVAEAVRVLALGGIVAYPTETFYGLGVQYDNAGALERLAALKGRHTGKAFPLIVDGEASLGLVAAEDGEQARALMSAHWPGALTILFPVRPGLPERISANRKVAVRMPGGAFAIELARAAGVPLTSTSANPSGMHPAVTSGEVMRYFMREGVDLLIDGGPTPGGEPSTIVDASGPELRLVRKGAVRIIGLS
jgi:L-threonylcarbamoyladenylate synthase